jgi:hypothetical protein
LVVLVVVVALLMTVLGIKELPHLAAGQVETQ